MVSANPKKSVRGDRRSPVRRCRHGDFSSQISGVLEEHPRVV